MKKSLYLPHIKNLLICKLAFKCSFSNQQHLFYRACSSTCILTAATYLHVKTSPEKQLKTSILLAKEHTVV